MAYTFGNQLSFLASLLGDSNTDTSSQWPLAQRKLELNESTRQFFKDSLIGLENATGTITDMELEIPSGWFETFSFYVTIGNVKYRLDNDREISPKDFERWSNYAGSIPYYYFWIFSQTKKIKLLGNSNTINGQTYDLYYFNYPTDDLSNDSDTPYEPQEYRQAPVFKAASNLLFQIGQHQKASDFLQLYNQSVQQAKSQFSRYYLDYDLPRPDFNIIEAQETDLQGQGYY